MVSGRAVSGQIGYNNNQGNSRHGTMTGQLAMPSSPGRNGLIAKKDSGLNVCQWIALGFLILTLLFLMAFIGYQAATWNKVRINRYG
ncbi:hypothetical protein FGO68_gene17720 [Halteria grandinella]|uniref:Uncharacterized protein n=1 Tax=Halteria grandinella TaxID=5974 RepID=A0A8J8SYS0_HALGN|nr:hypothetical protein FGO68_gene17720 [Halteria grandinella]